MDGDGYRGIADCTDAPEVMHRDEENALAQLGCATQPNLAQQSHFRDRN